MGELPDGVYLERFDLLEVAASRGRASTTRANVLFVISSAVVLRVKCNLKTIDISMNGIDGLTRIEIGAAIGLRITFPIDTRTRAVGPCIRLD